MSDQTVLIDQFLSSVIGTIHPDEIFDSIIDTAVRLLSPDGLLLTIRDDVSPSYHVTRSFGDISWEKDSFLDSSILLEQLLNADSYIPFMPGAGLPTALDGVSSHTRSWLIRQNIIGVYCLKYNRALIGFLFIALHNHMPLSADQVSALCKIGFYATHALRNANLYMNAYRASITDDLTALYNRKHAFEMIDELCLSGTPCSLIMLDIDDFKLYNELYGSKAGDHLIQRCAKIILSALDADDMAFRFGVDEFLILKRGSDAAAAKAFTQSLVEVLTKGSMPDMVWEITITCGISVFPDISADGRELIHNVEQAVYFGKLDGKGHLIVYRKGLENRSQNPDIRTAYERVAPTIYALTAAIDAKDNFTFIHSMNVSKYAVMLAEALHMTDNDIEVVRVAGMLHDIGKISIPEHILKKTEGLTPEEYAIMKTHVENSIKMIRYLPNMDYVIPAVVAHHERYDGTGYPRGLKGTEIPLMGRILTIADCFDAMTARRPYKQECSIDYAAGELKKNSGTQFDPELVPVFLSLIEDGKIAG